MSRSVAVVTDSTAYLPDELAAKHDIRVVPVEVIIDGTSYREGVEISAAEVADALRHFREVSTSRPNPTAFVEVYQRCVEAGADSIVSAHISGELSGAVEMAQLAAQESPVPVTVVDSRSVAMGLGFAVISGAEMAESGADAESIAAAIRQRATASKLFFYVDNLQYLKRGGRMGKGAAAIGTALRVKPILHMMNGKVELLEKERTTAKALARLADLSIAASAYGPADIAVAHIDALERAEELASDLRKRRPDSNVVVGEIGAAVGAHVGPGMVSVVVSPILGAS